MSTEIELVGGVMDGRRIAVPDPPPASWHVPIMRTPTFAEQVLATSAAEVMYGVLTYCRTRDLTNDGAQRYILDRP